MHHSLFLCVCLLSVFAGVLCNYAWRLPYGFPVGSMAIIMGIPDTNATYKAFSVNFLASSPFDGPSDIDFHLAVRFGDGHIATNNYIVDKGWQQEELYRESPIRGGPFEIMIISKPFYFSVYINDIHYVNFAHRMPLQRIKYLQVAASVTLSLITVNRQVYQFRDKPVMLVNSERVVTLCRPCGQ